MICSRLCVTQGSEPVKEEKVRTWSALLVPGPMALTCECARDQVERALVGVAILEILPAER